MWTSGGPPVEGAVGGALWPGPAAQLVQSRRADSTRRCCPAACPRQLTWAWVGRAGGAVEVRLSPSPAVWAEALPTGNRGYVPSPCPESSSAVSQVLPFCPLPGPGFVLATSGAALATGGRGRPLLPRAEVKGGTATQLISGGPCLTLVRT